MYRVENKYLLSDLEYFILKERLSAIMATDGNDDDSPDGYKISSIYFDDFSESHYNDTVNGNPLRKKYRIRIYNDSFGIIKAEIKIKKYNRIKKLSKKITYEQMQSLLHGESADCLEELDDPVFLFNMAIKNRGLNPKIIVTYERKAFVHEAGNVRITFDSNVRASDQIDGFGNKNLTYDYVSVGNFMANDSILEVKYDEFLPTYIAQTLEINQMWQTAYSKYQVCRERYM